MKIPTTRGPVSAGLLGVLASAPGEDPAALADLSAVVTAELSRTEGIIGDGDIQLALFCLYELYYCGLEGADDRWEWNPGLIGIRQLLEEPFELALRSVAERCALPCQLKMTDPLNSDGVAAILFELAAQDTGPSLSRYVARKATVDQLREFLIHKSVYQLKEADPHTWAIPRLSGRAKAALVEIQSDEYGGGRPDRMHSALFARTMRGVGLSDQYGHYVDSVPAVSLASVNLMSLFGLTRRLRGAIAGHLAIYEMTSSRPNQLYGKGFRRHGFESDVTWYFDEHVEADAVHEQIAGRDLAGGLVEAEPSLLPDVIFGATAALAVDGRLSAHILDAWDSGRSSLRSPVRTLA